MFPPSGSFLSGGSYSPGHRGNNKHWIPLRKARLAPILGSGATVAAAALLVLAGAAAQTPASRMEVWDIKLGTALTDIPVLAFQEYACGTDGGPPGKVLRSFADFAECQSEPSGLTEVYFRYDDESEYVARAREAQVWIDRLEGTRVVGAPAIVSVLVGSDGRIDGLRIVTDQRASLFQRQRAHTFRNNFKARFGSGGWECRQAEPDELHMPVGRQFVDEHCEKDEAPLHLVVEARFYRKPGQSAFDPVTRELTPGRFESSARLEITLLDALRPPPPR